MTLILIGIVALIVAGIALFVNLSPQFGGKVTKTLVTKYAKSNHWDGEKFINLQTTTMDIGFMTMPGLLKQQFKKDPSRRPTKNIDVLEVNEVANATKPRLTWFGHSAFLLEIGEKNILIDPMFGQVPAPHPNLGQKRYSTELPIAVQDLPIIDAIILSHDHYDHLDYGSIMALKSKVKHYYVPLGCGRHFERWGIDSSLITEMDWWQETQFENIQLAFTPSRHFSGRGITDRAKTLWGSWVIKTDSSSIFFSGDGGYGEHFKEIGDKYGPFDFAMMECGQYNKLWEQIHCMPEQTAQAAVDVRAKVAMPIHWGAFTLALHPWTEPIERVTKKADELNLQLCTPKIGEPVIVGELYPASNWWKEY